MKKFLFLIVTFLLINNVGFCKEVYTNLSDPINNNTQTWLSTGKKYISDTGNYNGMDYEIFSRGCVGEDYLLIDGGAGGYALTGSGNFISNPFVGKYTKVTHSGIDKENYSAKVAKNWNFECDDEECPDFEESFSRTLYKACRSYSSADSSWCVHAQKSYNQAIGNYTSVNIKNGGRSTVSYYIYGGMPNLPLFSIVTSIDPRTGDLWVATFSAKNNYYNAGVYQLFDSNMPYIKNVASPLTNSENSSLSSTKFFNDVQSKALRGEMYYIKNNVVGSVNKYFLVCNECATCERCETSNYGNKNTYVAYGEIPEFYLSRGCPLHACCFAYDYPVVLPDEYEGAKCVDLKIEGEKFIACEDHTCKRWLNHSDYRESFSPQACLKVVAGRVITDAASGKKEIRYTGPADEGLISIDGSFIVTEGGYSNYCANHMCTSFFCASARENSETNSASFDKSNNLITMPNKYCSDHKSGCRVVHNYKNQPEQIKLTKNSYGDTIVEQIEKDRLEKKYKFCDKKVSQSFFSSAQTNTLICEDCYNLMKNNKLNYNNSTKNLNVGKCEMCGDTGVSKFAGLNGCWCATCIDFEEYSIIHRNMDNYDYYNVKGTKRTGKCEFNIQRFMGDDSLLCGEDCVDGKRYCYWHLCDGAKCSNPVKYDGSFFCGKCVPYLADSQYRSKKIKMSDAEVERLTKKSTNPIVKATPPVDVNWLKKILSEDKGVEFTYKGKNIKLSSNELKSLLNMLNHECTVTEAQSLLVLQCALNMYIDSWSAYNQGYNMLKIIAVSFYEQYLSGSNSVYDIKDYSYHNNVYLAFVDVLNNSQLSQDVADIIKDSKHYAGTADRDIHNNLVEAMESYIKEGVAFSIKGTIIEKGVTGRYFHDVCSEVFPARCEECRENGLLKFIGADGKCFECKKVFPELKYGG